jgi:hypothetical protein
VQQIDRSLVVGQRVAAAVLDRRGQGRALALVAQVSVDGMAVVGSLGQRRQHLGMSAQRGSAVLEAGPHPSFSIFRSPAPSPASRSALGGARPKRPTLTRPGARTLTPPGATEWYSNRYSDAVRAKPYRADRRRT